MRPLIIPGSAVVNAPVREQSTNTGPSDYLLKNIALVPSIVDAAGEFQIMLGNDPAFLATRVA